MMTTDLDEKDFIRHKLHYSEDSPFRKYQELTSGAGSLSFFLKYELVTSIFGPMPGAAGYFFRKCYFPALFRSCGKDVIWGRNLTIRHPRNISLGQSVTIDDYALLDGRGAEVDGVVVGDNAILGRGATIQSKVGPIRIGANCNIGSFTVIVSQGGVSVGDWTQIAGGCKISGGSFRVAKSPESPFPFERYSKGPIRIGSRCFIGGSVQVTDGIVIGDGCLIGTGSVVMSNIPENSIYVPKPGMIVGKTV